MRLHPLRSRRAQRRTLAGGCGCAPCCLPHASCCCCVLWVLSGAGPGPTPAADAFADSSYSLPEESTTPNSASTCPPPRAAGAPLQRCTQTWHEGLMAADCARGGPPTRMCCPCPCKAAASSVHPLTPCCFPHPHYAVRGGLNDPRRQEAAQAHSQALPWLWQPGTHQLRGRHAGGPASQRALHLARSALPNFVR